MKRSFSSSKELIFILFLFVITSCNNTSEKKTGHNFNDIYSEENLNYIAFPLGGIGAGMICLEGTGSIAQVSVRNKPDVHNEPFQFAAISVKGIKNGAKVLQGIPPARKSFGLASGGNGGGTGAMGFPHFEEVTFAAQFPYGLVNLRDKDIPMEVELKGWSPFIPCDEDNSSLPVAALEYTFKNTSSEKVEAVFSYHADNFMRIGTPGDFGPSYDKGDSIKRMKNGFILSQSCFPDKPHYKGDFAIFTEEDASVDYCWFRGSWFDPRTQLWKDIESCNAVSDTNTTGSKSASLYVPFSLEPGKEKTIKVYMAWYVPHSDIRLGWKDEKPKPLVCKPGSGCCPTDYSQQFYEPWYSERFKNIDEVSRYWLMNYSDLNNKTNLFTQSFYSSNLPAEVIEAVAANLGILKSPTVLRQRDGRMWAFEGCFDAKGCCPGSCTHVWNYAQAIPNLFPALERTFRETEFLVSQNEEGHQNFRSHLPIREPDHGFHAAADGQLGGIMKVYREYLISGDIEWLKKIFPNVKSSFDYCSKIWDPMQKGILEEPHHNTYDIEFWGPDGMCTSFYLGATAAMIKMCAVIGTDASTYKTLLEKGKKYIETELYDGEYFYQKVVWEGLNAKSPVDVIGIGNNYSPEALELLKKEGPKYQYGTGCLSDGVLGCWIADMCGVGSFLDSAKVKSHLNSVHKYNLKTDLSDHVNPQRPGYASGKEGGLLLCSWPKGGALTLPFVYSNEVWTGIEYQVASHLMLNGEVEKGLEIVREVRKRYDGKTRNPFDEYECGHWYARAMSSYGLLKGLTGFFYNAVDKSLTIKSHLGKNFKCFISTETGYGLAGLKDGKPFVDVKYGKIEVLKFILK